VTTLNVNGHQVKVDDSFTGMTPAQQQSVVNEIAAHLTNGVKSGAATGAAVPDVTPPAAPAGPGTTAAPPPGLTPGSTAYANWARDQTVAGHAVPQVSGAPPPTNLPDVMPAPLRAFSTHAIQSLPVVGGPLSQMGGHNTPMGQMIDQQAAQQAPSAATAGDVFGTVAPFVAAGGVPGVARAIGMDAAAPIGEQMLRSGVTQATLSGADAAVRGENPGDIAVSTGLGGILGSAGPLVGAGVGQVVKGAGNLLGGARDLVQGMGAFGGKDAVAARQVGTGIAQDVAAGGTALSPADRAAAVANGQPVINADSFGDNTKGVLQSSMAQVPESTMNTVKNFAADRGTGAAKAVNAVDFINNLTGNKTDYQAAQDAITRGKAAVNPQAYDAAYNHPAAGSIWNNNIANMVNTSQTFQDAIKMTTKTAGDDAAAHGTTAIKNPFRFNSDGSYQIAQGQTPSLPFWDQVQRNLGTLAKNEGGYDGANILQMRTNLNNELDGAVPPFQTARQGAATFFGADNALDAGQKYALSNQDPNAAAAAFAKFSPQEKQLFGVGLASRVVNKLNDASISPTAVDKIFMPPDPATGSLGSKAYQQMQLGLSGLAPSVRTQLPAFARVSQAMTDTNSFIKNAAAQKVTSQLGGVIGQHLAGAAVGGALGAAGGSGSANPADWFTGKASIPAVLGAAAGAGARSLGTNVDKAVAGRIVQMLSSGDPAAIHNAVVYATRNPKAGAALKAIQHGVASMVGRGVQAVAAPAAATAAPMLTPPIAAAAQPDPSQAPAQ
jgi:hypothetical protein